jgi:hypothetical protein
MSGPCITAYRVERQAEWLVHERFRLTDFLPNRSWCRLGGFMRRQATMQEMCGVNSREVGVLNPRSPSKGCGNLSLRIRRQIGPVRAHMQLAAQVTTSANQQAMAKGSSTDRAHPFCRRQVQSNPSCRATLTAHLSQAGSEIPCHSRCISTRLFTQVLICFPLSEAPEDKILILEIAVEGLRSTHLAILQVSTDDKEADPADNYSITTD